MNKINSIPTNIFFNNIENKLLNSLPEKIIKIAVICTAIIASLALVYESIKYYYKEMKRKVEIQKPESPMDSNTTKDNTHVVHPPIIQGNAEKSNPEDNATIKNSPLTNPKPEAKRQTTTPPVLDSAVASLSELFSNIKIGNETPLQTNNPTKRGRQKGMDSSNLKPRKKLPQDTPAKFDPIALDISYLFEPTQDPISLKGNDTLSPIPESESSEKKPEQSPSPIPVIISTASETGEPETHKPETDAPLEVQQNRNPVEEDKDLSLTPEVYSSVKGSEINLEIGLNSETSTPNSTPHLTPIKQTLFSEPEPESEPGPEDAKIAEKRSLEPSSPESAEQPPTKKSSKEDRITDTSLTTQKEENEIKNLEKKPNNPKSNNLKKKKNRKKIR